LHAFQKPDFTPDNLKNACGVKTVFVPLQCERIEVEVQKVAFRRTKAMLSVDKSYAFKQRNGRLEEQR
jgi:hypothetical protein